MTGVRIVPALPANTPVPTPPDGNPLPELPPDLAPEVFDRIRAREQKSGQVTAVMQTAHTRGGAFGGCHEKRGGLGRGMEALLLRFTRCERIPLNLRRMLGNRLLPRSSREFELPMGERAFRGRLDNYIDRVVYLTGRYFEYTYLRLFRKLSPPTGCALDIGANVGNHSLALSAHFESVHAFEPYPPVYAELVERTASVPNIVCHRTALGARPGSLAFAPPEGENLGTGRIATGGKLEVPVSTGDEIVAERIEEPVSFIKVDTEGHELEVLDGLRKTLAAHQPVVAFEIPKRTDLSKAEGFAAVMERLPDGYRFYGLPSQSTFPVQRAVARPEPYEARGFRSRWKMGLALPAGA